MVYLMNVNFEIRFFVKPRFEMYSCISFLMVNEYWLNLNFSKKANSLSEKDAKIS